MGLTFTLPLSVSSTLTVYRVELEKEPPEELVARHRLPELCAWYESVGAQALVLGCTHFPYFKEVLARQIHLPILDPAEEMLRLLDT